MFGTDRVRMQLVVNLPWITDGLSDLLAQQLAASLAETMCRRFDGPFGHVQSLAEFSECDRIRITAQVQF